jgi:hypothetical protein
MEDPCVVWTVVERPIYINTCFASSTVVIIEGYTTTIPNPTCIHTTITASQTMNPPPSTPAIEAVEYTTFTTDIYTTVCPSPTIFTHGTRTYTVTKATTITITGEWHWTTWPVAAELMLHRLSMHIFSSKVQHRAHSVFIR